MFLSVIFCFFFKHKTAYEMRISDWSSDVCSSDLRSVQAIDTAAAADFSGKIGRPERIDIAISEDRPSMAKISDGLIADSPAMGIGRASWRERVCQDV